MRRRVGAFLGLGIAIGTFDGSTGAVMATADFAA